jgi:hypothetical protein
VALLIVALAVAAGGLALVLGAQPAETAQPDYGPGRR